DAGQAAEVARRGEAVTEVGRQQRAGRQVRRGRAHTLPPGPDGDLDDCTDGAALYPLGECSPKAGRLGGAAGPCRAPIGSGRRAADVRRRDVDVTDGKAEAQPRSPTRQRREELPALTLRVSRTGRGRSGSVVGAGQAGADAPDSPSSGGPGLSVLV